MSFCGLLSIVIPVYRSESYLRRTVDELVRFFEQHGEFEVILVNDGSPDGVQRVIDELHASDSRIRFVERGANSGQHSAILRGFAVSRGDVVITLDDDGQNPPAAGLRVIEELQQRNLDVVFGRFTGTEQSRSRVLASRLNGWITRHTLGNRLGVSVSNVRALRGGLARALGRTHTMHPYIEAMIFRATSRIGDTTVEHRARREGRSTYNLSALLRLWISHLTMFSALPLRIATIGCFSVSVLGLLVGIAQLVRSLVYGQAPAGWLSLFVAVTFLFSILFAFLGVISTYLGRLYVSFNAQGLVWDRTTDEDRQVAKARPVADPVGLKAVEK